MRIRRLTIRRGVMKAVRAYIAAAEKSYHEEVEGILTTYREEIRDLKSNRDLMIDHAAESRIDKIVKNLIS